MNLFCIFNLAVLCNWVLIFQLMSVSSLIIKQGVMQPWVAIYREISDRDIGYIANEACGRLIESWECCNRTSRVLKNGRFHHWLGCSTIGPLPAKVA